MMSYSIPDDPEVPNHALSQEEGKPQESNCSWTSRWQINRKDIGKIHVSEQELSLRYPK